MVWLLILLFVVFVLCVFLGDENDGWYFGAGISFCGGVLVVILVMMNWYNLFQTSVIPEKIKMYQEENTKIENEISLIVESYKDYEQSTFKDLKSISAITLITMYPELKSDALVNKQIEVYIANNQKIKELKEMLINKELYHKMLYLK